MTTTKDHPAIVAEASRQKRLVEIAAPINPQDHARKHRVSLMGASGIAEETYLAPTLDCALAVAELLLRGEEVPKNYFANLTDASH
ncbi:hypothetical protein D3877_19925 [Azospirillum cavernae]|uniref:Uncharacterized protein n=1 Tax=Azospirillum cavernae TaxID=2320860 RepID=A0A418VYS6_9PROT|nr:hypothetical protein [Azospirillum cavernae]RJF82312.1 hypothetical protein D3877_19925 [Azospirillum cavernae]